MNLAILVDLVVVLLAVLAAYSGYRQGALASAFAFGGVVLGAVAGILLAPQLVSGFDEQRTRLFLGIGLVVLLVIIGETAGMVIGRAIRSGLHTPVVRGVDSVVGSFLQVAAVLVALWLLAIPLTSAASGSLASGVRDSRVLGAVDDLAPDWLRGVPSEFSALLDTSGLPEVIGPFGSPKVTEVGPPDTGLNGSPVVSEVRPSVLKISGVARSCRQSLEGTGFVIAPERVVTNAHVVAGTDTVSVQTSVGGTLEARVVWFNARNDVAVLDVPGLVAPALPFADSVVASGTDAIVLGFPGGGDFTVTPVRVRDVISLTGPDIYRSNRQVVREVYTLRGDIRQGNSGGPLLTSSGQVLGLVFGASPDPADETGFALTAEQIEADLGGAAENDAPVNTQTCINS